MSKLTGLFEPMFQHPAVEGGDHDQGEQGCGHPAAHHGRGDALHGLGVCARLMREFVKGDLGGFPGGC